MQQTNKQNQQQQKKHHPENKIKVICQETQTLSA